MIVVIPTSREIHLEYLGPLIEYGARFIIIDDTEGSIRIDHPQFLVYNWADRRRMLKRLDHGIPRRTGACRDFGFYIAWKETSDDEVIIALDDDCVVEEVNYAEAVVRGLEAGKEYTVSGGNRHFNIFDLYENVDSSRIFPRGFPYAQRAGYKPWRFDPCAPQPVMFNLGLWKGIFDVNAIDKLHLDRWSFPDAHLRIDGVMIPPNILLSLCSGHMHLRRSVIPAIYQLPMNVEVVPNWYVDRYGDIWGGFILKTLMDIRGHRLSVGGPLVRHINDGDIQRNIRHEHLGHLVNDEFIQLLDALRARIAPACYLDMMNHLREELVRAIPSCSPIMGLYLNSLTKSLQAWLAALK